MGVEGWYSTRSDFTATWEDQGTVSENQQTVSNGVFSSKYYNEDDEHIYTYISQGTWVSDWPWGGHYEPPYTIVSGEDQNPQNNNRMYLVQLTSTNQEYIVARPKTEYEDGQLITVDDDDNNQLVSPAFMLASQLGTASSAISWRNAKIQCKNYVEVIKYSEDEEPRVLDDWRLPTYMELSIIADYQKLQPDVLDEVLRGSNYWSACEGVSYAVPNPTQQGTRGVRCVRDVTPDDLKEFAAHGYR